MKKLFQKWLFLFVLIAFILTFISSYFIHSELADKSARELLSIKLSDAKDHISKNQENLEVIKEMTGLMARMKATTLAEIIKLKPDIVNDMEELEILKEKLDVDELHISNAEGILVASIPVEYKGYDMHDSEQSAEFLPAITNKDFSLVQKPRENGIEKVLFQYAGVARLDEAGIVQIGYKPQRLQNAMKLADVEYITSHFRIGTNGILRTISREPNFSDGRFFKEEVNGIKSLSMAIPCGEYTIIGNLPEDEMYLSRNSVVRILIIGNLVIFIVIFFLVSSLLQKVVIRGIYSVNNTLDEITKGNLDQKIKVDTTPEFKDLSVGINSTVNALKDAISAEAKRLDAELEVARIIQSSVLPTEFPKNENLEIFASMKTAKEVGGDFYDFFMVDDTHMAMIIADISGKGITAALYMMTSKTLIKDLALANKSAEEVFSLANEELSLNNQANMFLTAYIAILDTETGILQCVNAGHNPPLLKKKSGKWEYLNIKHSIALGAFEMANYTSVPIQLEAGDRLFFYTDGVSEAMNRSEELYGEDRLEEFLNAHDGSPKEISESLGVDIAKFADGAEQSDDITILALDFFGASKK